MTVRRATKADVDALVRLRGWMFEAMGAQPGPDDAPWRAAAATWFAEAVDSPDFAAFVVDDAELGVVACAAAVIDSHAPGPDGGSRRGHLFNVCTDPRRRRRGLARDCVVAVVEWLDGEVALSNLSATRYGIELYRSLGYRPGRFPTMRRDRAMLEP